MGRKIEKTIIVDNMAENFELQPENGIFIQSWFGDPKDKALFELAPLLKGNNFFRLKIHVFLEIVKKNVGDVRKALVYFKDQMMQNIAKGIPEPHKFIDLSKLN